MSNYEKYCLLASGEASNGAPVPFGVQGFLVDQEYAKTEFSSDHQNQIQDFKKWAGEKESVLLYSSQGGYFFRARLEILQKT